MLQRSERFQNDVKQYTEAIAKMPDGQEKLEATRLLNDLVYEVNFSDDDIDELPNFVYPPISITSEFPHGYSLNMGRSHYYYSEYIAHNIMSPIVSQKLSFKCSTKLNEDEDFMIGIKSDSIYNDNLIKSMILDINLPFAKKPWLVKDRTTDCIIF